MFLNTIKNNPIVSTDVPLMLLCSNWLHAIDIQVLENGSDTQ